MRVAHPWEPDAEPARPGLCSTGVETALLVAAAVAAAGTAYSIYASGQAQQAAGEYNADVAEQQAQAARASAAVDEEAAREKARRIQAAARAAYGASGVSQEEGSPLLVLMDNAAQAELEAQRIRYAGELAATGYGNQATLARTQGAQAAQAGQIGAGISLLSSGASIGYRAYYGMNRPGDFAALQSPAYQAYRRGERF
jgi:hypothetical protein